MARRSYDPLTVLPSPDAIRDRLREAQALVGRLTVLLAVAEVIRDPMGDPGQCKVAAGEEAPHVR